LVLDLIEKTVQLFSGRSIVQQTALSIEAMDPDLRQRKAYLNSSHFMQIVTSLLGNALDAVEGQENSWVKVVVESQDDFAVIKVINSGPLIPVEVRSRLMEAFFTTKPIGKGTGLGLSMSQAMVEGMNGKLFLDETQANTCFVVSIPWLAH
jgi:C4-dicarboxylate-specific signal transduction histidine kinase